MASAAELLVIIDATTEKLRREMAQANRSIERFQKQSETQFTKFEGRLASLGRGAGAAIAAYVGTQLGRALVDRTIKLQDLNVRLVTLTGSQAAAAETQEYLFQTAGRLNAEVLTLSDSYAKLLPLVQANVLSTKEARAITEGFANVAAATGAGAAQLGQAMFGLSQGLSAGTLRAEELNQVTEPLPGLLQKLDQAAGLASGGFRKMVNDGQVTATMFRDTLIKAFGEYEGAAEKMSGNASASISRLDNAWTRLAASLSTPIGAVAKDSLNGLAQILDKVSGLAEGTADRWNLAFGTAAEKIKASQRLQEQAQASMEKNRWNAQYPLIYPTAGLEYQRDKLFLQYLKKVEDEASVEIGRSFGKQTGVTARIQKNPDETRGAPITPAIDPEKGPTFDVVEEWQNNRDIATLDEAIARAQNSQRDFNFTAAGQEYKTLTRDLEDYLALLEREAGIKADLIGLEVETLNAQAQSAARMGDYAGAMALRQEAIRKTADVQIEAWQKVAREVPAFAQYAADAIAQINKKTAEDIANVANPELERMRDFAQQFAATFSSAFEDAIFSGDKFGGVLKGLTQDLLRLMLRLMVIQPLMDGLTKSMSGGGVFSLGGIVAGLFGGFKAEGGNVRGRIPYIVGEKGPELFIPGASGTIIPNKNIASGRDGGRASGVVVNITQTISPNFAGNAATRQDVIQMAALARQSAIDGVRDGLSRNRGFLTK